MKIRRVLSLFVTALMILVTGAGIGTVQAAGAVQVSVTASPSQLSGAGTVELHISIVNASSSNMEDVSVTGQGVNEVLASIPAGGTQNLYYDYLVTESMLGKPITFSVRYNGQQTATGSVTIGRLAVAPNVVLERTSDVSAQEVGKSVVFTYTVYNRGLTSISNVVLHDEFTDDALNKPFSLDPGKSKQVKHTYIMEGNTVSRPSVSFNTGGKSYINTIDALYVTVPQESLIVEVYATKVEVKRDEELSIHCKITNQIGRTIRDITVADEKGEVLGDAFSLEGGQSTTLSKTFTLTGDRKYAITANGYDENGNAIEASSDPIQMSLLSAENPTDLLTVLVEPSIKQLDEPGTVAFSITISNQMEDTLSNVVVSEKTRGELATFDALGTGDKLVSQEYEVTKDETFVFTVSAKDQEGNTYVVSSGSVDIKVGGQTPTPTLTAVAAAGSGLGTFLTVVLIIVALIVIAAVVLTVLLLQERKAKKLAAANPQAAPAEDVQEDAGEESSADGDASFLPPEIDDEGPGAEMDGWEETAGPETGTEPDPEKGIDDIENPVE